MEHETQSSEARFVAYVDALSAVLGREDRAQPPKDYCTGLLMPGERKSVEPIAAVVAPSRVSAKHQSLLHLVGQASWSDEAVLNKVRELVAPAIEAQGGIEAWIVDDTGFVKKIVHSVGVSRQYCGRLGKTDNCQIAVTLSIANHAASLPIAYLLYLPEDWTQDAARRRKTHVPDEADELGLAITVHHLPPGTSKWNKIEHRLFAQTRRDARMQGDALEEQHVLRHMLVSAFDWPAERRVRDTRLAQMRCNGKTAGFSPDYGAVD